MQGTIELWPVDDALRVLRSIDHDPKATFHDRRRFRKELTVQLNSMNTHDREEWTREFMSRYVGNDMAMRGTGYVQVKED